MSPRAAEQQKTKRARPIAVFAELMREETVVHFR
jgi:hypothetical protein